MTQNIFFPSNSRNPSGEIRILQHWNFGPVYYICVCTVFRTYIIESVCMCVRVYSWFNNFNSDCQLFRLQSYFYLISLFHYCDNNFIVVILSPLFNRTIGCDCSVLLFTCRSFFLTCCSILFCIFYRCTVYVCNI